MLILIFQWHRADEGCPTSGPDTHTHRIKSENTHSKQYERGLSTQIFSVFSLHASVMSFKTHVKNRASIRASLHLHAVPHQPCLPWTPVLHLSLTLIASLNKLFSNLEHEWAATPGVVLTQVK